MNKTEFPLSEKELAFKTEYENGGYKYLESPMTYNEFERLSDRQKMYYADMEKYHESISMNMPGYTVKEVTETGYSVEVVVHGRYSYPIMHNHANVELMYVYSGQCTHFIEKQVLTMKEGDLCILAPAAMHGIAVKNDDTIIISIMMSKKIFDLSFWRILKGGKLLVNFLEHVFFNKQVSPYMIFPTGSDEWLHQTALEIYHEWRLKDYLYNESVTLYVKQIFIHLIRHYELMAIVSNPMDNSQEKNIVALMGYITVNYSHVTLRQMAHFFGYNEAYLGQLIKKYMNKSFNMLVTELQMENARQLLKESNMSITEIGCKVGCCDSSHFTRKFKKAFGITPNLYRKQYLTSDNI